MTKAQEQGVSRPETVDDDEEDEVLDVDGKSEHSVPLDDTTTTPDDRDNSIRLSSPDDTTQSNNHETPTTSPEIISN